MEACFCAITATTKISKQIERGVYINCTSAKQSTLFKTPRDKIIDTNYLMNMKIEIGIKRATN